MTAPTPPTPPPIDFTPLMDAMQALGETIAANTAKTGGPGGGDPYTILSGAVVESLANQLSDMAPRLKGVLQQEANTFAGAMANLSDGISQNSLVFTKANISISSIADQISALTLSDPTKNAAAIDSLTSKMAVLQEQAAEASETLDELSTINRSSKAAAAQFVKQNQLAARGFDGWMRAFQTNPIGTIIEGITGKTTGPLIAVIGAMGLILRKAMQMAMVGVQQASQIGVTAQEGVALDFKNQGKALGSIVNNLNDPNKMFGQKDLFATNQATVGALGGVGAGREISPDAGAKLLTDLRTGFNSQITPSAEMLKNLTLIGATTTESFTALRVATGRQGLSATQLTSILGKNMLSFMIFGNNIAKRAADLDRLGISLDSVNKGAEGYVTNLDGQIDAIAQLNQLGVDLDFGQLTQLMEFDPDAAQELIASKISPQQLQSSSFRALLGQVGGVDVEQLMRRKGAGGFDALSEATTNAKSAESPEVGIGYKAFTTLAVGFGVLSGTMAGFTVAIGLAAAAAWYFSRRAAAAAATMSAEIIAAGVTRALAAKTAAPLAGDVAAGRLAERMRTRMGAGGTPATPPIVPPTAPGRVGMFTSARGGLASGATRVGLGALNTPVSGIAAAGGTSAIIGTVLAVLAAGAVGYGIGTLLNKVLPKTAGEKMKAAADERDARERPAYEAALASRRARVAAQSLNTPTQPSATADSLPRATPQTPNIAPVASARGTQTTATDPVLISKITDLITVLSNANTTIEVNGQRQLVNRSQIVRVLTRDHVENA